MGVRANHRAVGSGVYGAGEHRLCLQETRTSVLYKQNKEPFIPEGAVLWAGCQGHSTVPCELHVTGITHSSHRLFHEAFKGKQVNWLLNWQLKKKNLRVFPKQINSSAAFSMPFCNRSQSPHYTFVAFGETELMWT